MTIQQIAKMLSGIYVNTSTSKGEDVYYLQVRHWDKERAWIPHIKPELIEETKLHKNYLREGDILLATKGVDIFAVLYDGLYSPAIASSVFTVLRIQDRKMILPAYLQWYLNHPATNRKLFASSKGTSIPLITRDIIEELEIPVPEIKNQELIIKIEQLRLKASRLRARLTGLKENIIHHNLLQIANQK